MPIPETVGAVAVGALALYGLILAAIKWIPVAGEQPKPNLSPLAQIILGYNNSQMYWVGGVTVFTEPTKGVTLHKITATQAQSVATELEAVVSASEPTSIACALLGSESVMDPQCENGNYLGSNTAKDALGFDDGIAQEKLRYLVGQPGVTDAPGAQAFAFDVTRAIPYFWSLYQSHVATADGWIAAGGPSNIDPRLMNRYILAAVIYKQGATGGRAIFEAATWPEELNNFVSLEKYFAAKLSVPSVFLGLS
jgi:hypothetical protein